jgi:hypothetical protein
MGEPVGHMRPSAHVQVLSYPFQRHAGFGPHPARHAHFPCVPLGWCAKAASSQTRRDMLELDERLNGSPSGWEGCIRINDRDDRHEWHLGCRSLTKPDLIQILGLEIGKVLERLKKKNIQLELDEPAKDFLVERGYDPQYGARPMRRAVERYLEDPLAEEIIRGNLHENDPIHVTVEDGKLAFHQDKPSEAAVAS